MPTESCWATSMRRPVFTAYDIGYDYILGKTVDEFDVERVVLYRLIKP